MDFWVYKPKLVCAEQLAGVMYCRHCHPLSVPPGKNRIHCLVFGVFWKNSRCQWQYWLLIAKEPPIATAQRRSLLCGHTYTASRPSEKGAKWKQVEWPFCLGQACGG